MRIQRMQSLADCLGMALDCSIPGKVQVSMIDYVKIYGMAHSTD